MFQWNITYGRIFTIDKETTHDRKIMCVLKNQFPLHKIIITAGKFVRGDIGIGKHCPGIAIPEISVVTK